MKYYTLEFIRQIFSHCESQVDSEDRRRGPIINVLSHKICPKMSRKNINVPLNRAHPIATIERKELTLDDCSKVFLHAKGERRYEQDCIAILILFRNKTEFKTGCRTTIRNNLSLSSNEKISCSSTYYLQKFPHSRLPQLSFQECISKDCRRNN